MVAYRAITRSIGFKLLGLALLASLNGSPVAAEEFNCQVLGGTANCPFSRQCEGTGYAYSNCAVWCYVNGGGTLVGYADCLTPIVN